MYQRPTAWHSACEIVSVCRKFRQPLELPEGGTIAPWEARMYAKVMAIMIAAALLAGCNTVQGIGKDVERGGERLQNAAEKAKN